MADGQQTDGGTVAGMTTPTPTPNVTDTVEYWKAQAESFESRYKGASTKINEYDKSVKTWQQKFAEKEAEVEGLRASSTNDVKELQTKTQTFEQQVKELSTKNAQYERKEKIRNLIHSDFKDLATDFEADPIYQSGILSAAEQMDEVSLKASLAKSLELRKGQRIAAIEGATSGGTPTPPVMGSGNGVATVDQIIEQLNKLPMDDPKRLGLMEKWREARRKSNS